MLPTPIVAAAAAKGAHRLAVNRLSHARLSWPDRPPEGRWRVPGGMGLRPTLPPAPPARNRRLRDSQQQWPPLACHPGASAAGDGHIVDPCPPELLAALSAILQSISSDPPPRPLLRSPSPPGVTCHDGWGDAALGLPHDAEVSVGRITGHAARAAAELTRNTSSAIHGHPPRMRPAPPPGVTRGDAP